jgi:hypothetical protein
MRAVIRAPSNQSFPLVGRIFSASSTGKQVVAQQIETVTLAREH